MPFLGPLHTRFNHNLQKLLKTFFTATDFRLCFVNSLTIDSMFRVKDSPPSHLKSSLVYLFNCPGCKFGTYIGSTSRQLIARESEHRGVSLRTFNPISNPENSAIRTHTCNCKKLSRIKGAHNKFSIKDFKILSSAPDHTSLHILESLYIRKHRPTLNKDSGPVQLFLS